MVLKNDFKMWLFFFLATFFRVMLSYRITPKISQKLTYLLLKLKDFQKHRCPRERRKLYLPSLKHILCRSSCFVENVTPVNSFEGVCDPALLICQRCYLLCMLG